MNRRKVKLTDPEWYKIEQIGEGIYAFEETGHVQSYLINGHEKSILVDTGTGMQNIREVVEPLAMDLLDVVNTHWHFDHIGGNALFERVGIAACEAEWIENDINNAELTQMLGSGFESEDFTLPKDFSLKNYRIEGSRASFTIADGECFELGDRVLEAIATPGHTAGHMCFLDHQSRSLFCGDFAYQDTFYVHFDESDISQFANSIKKVMTRMESFDRLLPGHGPYPLDKAFLIEVLAAFEEIISGAKPDVVDLTWGIECYRYSFDTFEVLVKPPGSNGFGLLRGGKKIPNFMD